MVQVVAVLLPVALQAAPLIVRVPRCGPAVGTEGVAVAALDTAHTVGPGDGLTPAGALGLAATLAAAFDYLTSLSAGMIEVPVAIVRSLQEVELIARIEEQALSPEKQELLRFYMLQIARLAGENG